MAARAWSVGGVAVDDGPRAGDRVVVAAFMALMIASGWSGAAGYDTTRDVAAALAIRELDAFPLHGPMLASTLHLGPLWFYVLALPLAVHSSWLAPALFVPALASLQFPLAYAAGRRLADRRLGLLWCALLALPGWGSFLLVGFAHTNAVPVTVMLVLYTLVRLAQERRPVWLVAAGGALTLAVHAHPTTAALAPVALAIAVVAIRPVGTLLRWGVVALAVAAIPFAPLVFEHAVAPSGLLRQSGDYVEGMVRAANLANVPALLYGVLARGPRVVAGAFCANVTGCAPALHALTLAVEIAALAGVVLAWRQHRALTLVALAVTLGVAAAIALLRPITPFYMTYALLPLLAGVGALGLHALCARAGSRGATLSAIFVGTLLALQLVTVAGIGATIASGHVRVPVLSRLDVKQDDPAAPIPEPWLPAHAIDASGAWLCAQPGPVVLHGTYANLEDMHLGLDRRLHCRGRDVRLLGADPAAAHHVGLALPLWSALGQSPAVVLGGLGVAPVARVLNPAAGYPVPDGSVYPPHVAAKGPVRNVAIDATLAATETLVISQPYVLWTAPPAIAVTANGVAQSPLARDAVSAVYRCAACDAQSPVAWRVTIDAIEPERVDVVTIAAPGRQ